MVQREWKRLALAGLLTVLGLSAGCENRHKARENARQAGRQVGEAAQEVRETTKEAVQGFKEGMGGSGAQRKDDATQAPGNSNEQDSGR
jgi:hypothetical protein